ncbi:LacI family DNA-binding transcriptional regulator [Georgenia thermotolerans]|uniref:Substrate-binding domain-containing protein n=1 Tax=Georgenia thermotolerans TaxID=527326 RepID=A0A7J5UTV1_9MICO|nr:LacI family DNA-binding transcriptional regulator [Georgenia thermotolerans]KAE8765690.1 substrate-binding domain-containing protein [Georgenia thermotolerans]
MGRKVTVGDVAASAGVSRATAARVLAGHTTVNPDMAKRVIKASEGLGYSANVVARALRTQRTDTVGMVVPSISNPYFVGAVEALEGVLAASGRALILCDSRDSADTEAARIEVLLNRMVDGLIVIPVSAEDSVAALRTAATQCRVVQFDRLSQGAGTDFVGSDNFAGVRQCVAHLRDRGCVRIAYVGAAPTTSTATERLRAFEGSTGGHPDGRVLLGEFTAAWGTEAALTLLREGRMPDGIVCGADVIAVSLLAALRAAGVEVPTDVKVVSYDNSGLGLLTAPRLTSVDQPLAAMAEETVRLLDAGLDAAAPPRKSIFAPKLIVRESTGG